MNVTDEECLQFFEQKFLVWAYVTSPAGAHGRGMRRTHYLYCEMFIIAPNLTIFPLWLSFLTQQTKLYTNFTNSNLKYMRNKASSDNWVLPII